jgi:hypothetical protein
MTIRFKCPHCRKPLGVKDNQAGKRVACPVCKKAVVIPAPRAQPADLEAFAAAALADPAAETKPEPSNQTIDFTCPFCDEDVKVAFELGGKQTPCPSCRHIVKVPLPKQDKPKDWRDLDKKGPAAAIVNLPEQLEGAWGTELKGAVSRTAMEEADALPEVVAEPVGVGGWIKRGLIATASVGCIALLFMAASRNRTVKHQQFSIKDALALVEEWKKDPKKEFPVICEAEIHRAAGELLLREGKGKEGRDEFFKTRAFIANNPKTDNDHDCFLIDLALTQILLGGTEDEIRAGQRFDWTDHTPNVLKELTQTVKLIKANEAKVIGMREIAAALIDRGKMDLAIGLASSLRNPAQPESIKENPVLPQQVGLLFAAKEGKDAKEAKTLDASINALLKHPQQLKGPMLPMSYVGYVEGHVRRDQLDEAKKLIEQLSNAPQPRLEANLAAASVLLADKNNPKAAEQAAPYVADALKALGSLQASSRNPWHQLQLLRVGIRTEHAEQVKKACDKLPSNFQRRAKLDWVLAQIDKAGVSASQDVLVKDFPEQESPEKLSPHRALAWIALARHLAHVQGSVQLPGEDSADGAYRVFINIGIALGKQDRQ